ncbi:hypothetical protein ACC817_28585 [Rhizobium ruizarguesonis]
MKKASRHNSPSAANDRVQSEFVRLLAQPITAKRIERALNRLAEIMARFGKEGDQLLPIYERLERELADYRAREQKMAEIRERAKRSKAARAPGGENAMDDSASDKAREQVDEWIRFHEAEIEAIEAGRLKHQTKQGDEPWRDTTDQILDHHRRSKGMHERYRKLLDETY